MFRIVKPVSAVAALIFGRLVSVVRALSGLVALRCERKPPPRPPERLAPLKASKHGEWDQWVQKIVSLAKEEIAEILPGWSIDIDSTHSLCHEFVLWAETPEAWGWSRLGPDGIVQVRRPRQVWGARVPVSDMEFHSFRSKAGLAQFVLKKLSGCAHDIRREASSPPEVGRRL